MRIGIRRKNIWTASSKGKKMSVLGGAMFLEKIALQTENKTLETAITRYGRLRPMEATSECLRKSFLLSGVEFFGSG